MMIDDTMIAATMIDDMMTDALITMLNHWATRTLTTTSMVGTMIIVEMVTTIEISIMLNL